MSFTWDWLLWSIIGTERILNYYQLGLADRHTDLILYRLGREKGLIIKECHIVKRTSEHLYRVMSYVNQSVDYTSCRSANEVCNVILTYIEKFETTAQAELIKVEDLPPQKE